MRLCYPHARTHARHATPHHATPRHATRRDATPRHATPRHAHTHATPRSAASAAQRHATQRNATQRIASQCNACSQTHVQQSTSTQSSTAQHSTKQGRHSSTCVHMYACHFEPTLARYVLPISWCQQHLLVFLTPFFPPPTAALRPQNHRSSNRSFSRIRPPEPESSRGQARSAGARAAPLGHNQSTASTCTAHTTTAGVSWPRRRTVRMRILGCSAHTSCADSHTPTGRQ